MKVLQDRHVLTLALNVPGPVAAARLAGLGATVTKVEPPGGDPLATVSPTWYRALHEGLAVQQIDLKTPEGRAALEPLLAAADLLLTANRPAALARLGLDWPALHARFPRLAQVAIVGHPSPRADLPGHDLTYVAAAGLVDPPRLPRTLVADLAGAERAVAAALAGLYGRDRGLGAGYSEVSLAEAAADFAAPLEHGLTARSGVLGGAFAGYNLYPTQDGWIAVAALEAHFWQRLRSAVQALVDSAVNGSGADIGTAELTRQDLERVFAEQPTAFWEGWAREQDLPIVGLGRR